MPDNSVTTNIPFSEFKSFYELIKDHAVKARRALEEEDADAMTELWREILGPRFPSTQKSQAEKTLLSAAVIPGFQQPIFPGSSGSNPKNQLDLPNGMDAK